jgi:hypothetical protein
MDDLLRPPADGDLTQPHEHMVGIGRVPSRSGLHRRVVRVSTGSAGIAVFP